jgi:thiamine pyrophosphokinase
VLTLGPYDAVLVANGTPPRRALFTKLIEQSAHLVAVDGGLSACRKLARNPDVLIGDFDSVQPDDFAWAKRRQVSIVKRQSQQTTDLEKALLYARRRGWRRIAVMAASGNRPDHYLNGLNLAFRQSGCKVHYYLAEMLVIPVSGRATLNLELKAGHTVSWFGFPDASGCVLEGVKWPIQIRSLKTSGFQSVSNLSVGPVHVHQQRGRSLLMISLSPGLS